MGLGGTPRIIYLYVKLAFISILLLYQSFIELFPQMLYQIGVGEQELSAWKICFKQEEHFLELVKDLASEVRLD